MSTTQLHLSVLTPQETVCELQVSSLRVPTETGQVGLRPRVEPLVLAVEPGLILVRQDNKYQFIGTAGGLLRCDGAKARLLTPLAVTGDEESAVIKSLEAALAQPSIEMEARVTLGRLQSSILREIRQGGKEKLKHPEGTK